MIQLEEKWMNDGGSIKSLNLPNRNNKKHLHIMLELNLAPEHRIPGAVLDKTLFKITWKEDGQPDDLKYYTLIDIARLPVKDMCDIICYASHGMNSSDCLAWFIEKYGVSTETEIALYCYKHITNSNV